MGDLLEGTVLQKWCFCFSLLTCVVGFVCSFHAISESFEIPHGWQGMASCIEKAINRIPKHQ